MDRTGYFCFSGNINYSSPFYGEVFCYIWFMKFVLDNISEITINVDNIFVKYRDNTTHLIETGGMLPIKFIRGYRSDLDAPILDHCI